MVFAKDHLQIDFFEYDYILEANILKVLLTLNNLSISILCIYRSPASDRHTFFTSLNDIILKENDENGFVVIIGDINLNIVGVDVTDHEYLDMFSKNGFRSFINVFSRTPIGFKHSCLDHIFT